MKKYVFSGNKSEIFFFFSGKKYNLKCLSKCIKFYFFPENLKKFYVSLVNLFRVGLP